MKSSANSKKAILQAAFASSIFLLVIVGPPTILSYMGTSPGFLKQFDFLTISESNAGVGSFWSVTVLVSIEHAVASGWALVRERVLRLVLSSSLSGFAILFFWGTATRVDQLSLSAPGYSTSFTRVAVLYVAPSILSVGIPLLFSKRIRPAQTTH